MSSMQSHIAIHQQRVALFALPNSTGLEEGSDVGSAEADAGHVSGESDISKNIEAWNPLSDNVATTQNGLSVDFSLLEGLQVDNTGRIPSTHTTPDAVIVGQALRMSTRGPSSYFKHTVNRHGHIQNSNGRTVGHAGLWPRDLCVVAHSDYIGEGYTLLHFAAGEVIAVLCQAPTGWWYGARKASRGWFPSSYVSPASSDAVEAVDNEYPIINVLTTIVVEAPPVQDPPNWAAEFGLSGFFTACFNGNKADINNFLRARPESANMLNDAGDTPLHIVAPRGYVDIVHSLLSQGAEVDSRNRTQATPLMGAVENGQLEVVRGLLSYGANAQLQDSRGHTPLEFFLLSTPGGPEVREMIRQLLIEDISPNLHDFRTEDDSNLGVRPDRQSSLEERRGRAQKSIDKLELLQLRTEKELQSITGTGVDEEEERWYFQQKLEDMNIRLDQKRLQLQDPGSASPSDDWDNDSEAFDAAVARATSKPTVAHLDLPDTSEISELLDASPTEASYDALVSAMARHLTSSTILAQGSVERAHRTLELASALGVEIGTIMRLVLSSHAWIDTLSAIAGNPQVESTIKEAIIHWLRQWSMSFDHDTDMSITMEALRKLDEHSPMPERPANEAEYASRPLPPLHAASDSSGRATEMTSVVTPTSADSNAGLYPWSRWQLSEAITAESSPFPRYGAGVNAVAGKEGEIYIHGGLVDGSSVKADLWRLERTSRMCSRVATVSEGPGPRVGHAVVLVGNAFVVLFGDTKASDSDKLDTTLYLMHTSSLKWTRAMPSTTPPARYGHSMCILGSCLCIFGGQQGESCLYRYRSECTFSPRAGVCLTLLFQ